MARLLSCWLLPRALSRYIGPEIWVAGWPQTEGMFCLDVHSRATSLMSTERRGAVSQQGYETLRGEEWQKQNKTKQKKRVGTVQNGQIWTRCNSSSKTISQPSFASLCPFTHILMLWLPINTRHASICLYRSAVNFQQFHSASQYLMYEKERFWNLFHGMRPSRFHSVQYCTITVISQSRLWLMVWKQKVYFELNKCFVIISQHIVEFNIIKLFFLSTNTV